jgi:hypothetical protein
MKTYFAGCLLIQGFDVQNWMNNKLLPKKIFSVSNCLCNHHPSDWGLDWAVDKDKIPDILKELKIDENVLKVYQAEIQQLFESNLLDWHGIFSSFEHANDFKLKYLANLNDIEIRCIGLHETFLDEFLAEVKDEKMENIFGIYKSLVLKNELNNNFEFLGYEILGYEWCGFHSFICNSLENEIFEILNQKPNEFGLYDDFEKARLISDYFNDEEHGAEPVLWQPWSIYKRI